VGPDLSVLNLVVLKKGVAEIPGLTDRNIPRRLGPKRANHIRQLFNLTKKDDVRKYVVRREIVPKPKELKEGEQPKPARKYPKVKAPKIQRLITPLTLQRKRHRIALKKRRVEKSKLEAAEYAKLLTQRLRQRREGLISVRGHSVKLDSKKLKVAKRKAALKAAREAKKAAKANKGKPAKETKAAKEATKTAKPAKETKAAKPAKEATKAAKPAKETKAAKPAKEATKAAKPAKETKAAKPAKEATKAAKPAKETKAAKPAKETKAAKPAKETKAAKPAQPKPAKEVKAAKPAQPKPAKETKAAKPAQQPKQAKQAKQATPKTASPKTGGKK